MDSLYHFFLRWCPEKYGDIDNINYVELGYTCIESEEQDVQETKTSNDQRRASWAFPWRRKSSKDVNEATSVTSSSPEDWEVILFYLLIIHKVVFLHCCKHKFLMSLKFRKIRTVD